MNWLGKLGLVTVILAALFVISFDPLAPFSGYRAYERAKMEYGALVESYQISRARKMFCSRDFGALPEPEKIKAVRRALAQNKDFELLSGTDQWYVERQIVKRVQEGGCERWKEAVREPDVFELAAELLDGAKPEY